MILNNAVVGEYYIIEHYGRYLCEIISINKIHNNITIVIIVDFYVPIINGVKVNISTRYNNKRLVTKISKDNIEEFLI